MYYSSVYTTLSLQIKENYRCIYIISDTSRCHNNGCQIYPIVMITGHIPIVMAISRFHGNRSLKYLIVMVTQQGTL